ncbi:MAG: carbon starvation CstA family protein [Ruminococcus sp.]
MGIAPARDYLNSYLLIFMIVGAVIGVFRNNPSCNLKAFTSFNVDGQYMFPILFVTIACGAVSGFHSLVSSGTASKQIENERTCFRFPLVQCLWKVCWQLLH